MPSRTRRFHRCRPRLAMRMAIGGRPVGRSARLATWVAQLSPRQQPGAAVSTPRSSRTVADGCESRRFTRSTSRNRAIRAASRPSSSTAGRAPARTRCRGASSTRDATASSLFDQRGCGAAAPHASLRRQHDLAPGRGHRAAAPPPRHRALAGVRRLVGHHARARLRAEASRRASPSWCCAASSCCASRRSTGSTSRARAALFPDALGGLPRADSRRRARRPGRGLPPPPDQPTTPARAARGGAGLERLGSGTSYLLHRRSSVRQLGRRRVRIAFARIECHYFVNGASCGAKTSCCATCVASATSRRDRAGPLRRRLSRCRAPGTCTGPGRRRISEIVPDAGHSALRAGHHARARQGDRPLRSPLGGRAAHSCAGSRFVPNFRGTSPWSGAEFPAATVTCVGPAVGLGTPRRLRSPTD